MRHFNFENPNYSKFWQKLVKIWTKRSGKVVGSSEKLGRADFTLTFVLALGIIPRRKYFLPLATVNFLNPSR